MGISSNLNCPNRKSLMDILFYFMIISVLINSSFACIGSGLCGIGGACYTPPPVSCGGGCNPGYSCGQYGCARNRLRLHSSNTLSLHKSANDDKPNKYRQTKNPNQMFQSCCENRGLPDACLQLCNFNTYTREAIVGMLLKTNACPIEAATEIQYCAAQGGDHRSCCVRNNVHTTLAGNKCLIFCDQRPQNATQLDFSYASCYERFEQMKRCFWHASFNKYD